MSEQLRTILIIIVSVSIFGLLVFVFVKNYIKNKISKYYIISMKIREFKLVYLSILFSNLSKFFNEFL